MLKEKRKIVRIKYWFIIGGVISNLLLSNYSFGQEKKLQLSISQYEVINVLYSQGVDLFYETIDLKLWIHLMNEEDLQRFKVATCDFSDPNFSKTLTILEQRISMISSKKINPSKLHREIILNEDFNPQLISITEPIIIDDYAFVFQIGKGYESVRILKRKKTGWDTNCFLEFYFVLSD